MTCESHVILLLAILVLKDSEIHIYFSNGCNVMSNIKISIEEFFSFDSVLGVPNVYPYNYYIWF